TAVHGGNAAFIAAVPHAAMHFLEYAAGVLEFLGNGLVVERRGETENVGVEDGAGTHARTQDVAVGAHDAGHGATVGIQGAGGVVGLRLHAHVPVLGEGDDARVV